MGLKKIANNIKLRLKVRKIGRSSYALGEMFDAIGHILILLPPLKLVKKDMKGLLDDLGRLFPRAAYTLVSHPGASAEYSVLELSSGNKLSPNETDLSWSGLPRRQFIEKIKNLEADLLIDLSAGKSQYNAYITACSGVPVRIGTYGSWGNPIYNIEIKSNYIQNEQLILKSIIEVLKNFRAGVNN
ncbi:MAG TPA: hypothetical protein ENO22_10610 [candidate division Zixibacteria bacterium]|nr:hypothetical protein [candidate division Zixibacteria bacterium]